MAYLGFDLDETLGSFGTVNLFLYFLDPFSYYTFQGQYPDAVPPVPELNTKLQNAFHLFAECLLKKEPALGILRPGIVEICQRVLELKNKGDVKSVVIYSNNGNHTSLLLAAKMIEIALERPGGLFCNFVSWFHPLRSQDVDESLKNDFPPSEVPWLYNTKIAAGELDTRRIGRALKSMRVLKEAFMTGDCENKNENKPTNESIYFFDDLLHKNIFKAIGVKNYFLVTKFQKEQEFAPILDCFIYAMKESLLADDPQYYSYIHNMFTIPKTNLDDIVQYIIQSNQHDEKIYKNVILEVWNDDTDLIIDKLNFIFTKKNKNLKSKYLGGNPRKSRSKRRRYNVSRKTRRR